MQEGSPFQPAKKGGRNPWPPVTGRVRAGRACTVAGVAGDSVSLWGQCGKKTYTSLVSEVFWEVFSVSRIMNTEKNRVLPFRESIPNIVSLLEFKPFEPL